MKRARVDRFLRLKQNGRSVREYSLEFDSLATHAPTIVADMADKVHRYVMGLDRYLIDGCMAVTLQPGMDIARAQAYAQGVEDRHRGVSQIEIIIEASIRGLDQQVILTSFKAGSLSSMLDFLPSQHRVHPHVSWVGGSIVWDIRNLVRALGRQGHRWAGV